MRRLLPFVLGFAVSGLLTPVGYVVAKETDGDVPLTGISVSLQPDLFTGTLTSSIPIEVPLGRNGMQPNLAISYESAGGNGWVGVGWKLEMGAIERQTRWGVLYQPTAAEEQAGKVYAIRMNGVSTDLVQDTVDPLLYHEKIKRSFLRVKKLSLDGTAGWEITDTKGTKYKFGAGVATRIQGSVSGLGTQIFKWCLEEIRDRDGNYMKMTYTPDQGQGYLSQIDYTGNGTGIGPNAPSNMVKFHLEDRTDKPVMYTSYFPITTAKRLKTIEIRAGGNSVSAYKFMYSAGTEASIFTGVQRFGKDATVSGTGVISGGTALPPHSMTYSSSIDAFSNNSWLTVAGWAGNTYPIATGDFNGDGKNDVLVNAIPSGNYHVLLSNGAGFTNGVWLTVPSWANFTLPMAVGDFDGDGKSDVLVNVNQSGAYDVLLSNGSSFTRQNWLTVPGWAGTTVLPMTGGDFNGDGKSDVVVNAFQSGSYHILLSSGSNFTNQQWLTVPGWAGTTVLPMAVGDFNGDGKNDVLVNAFQGGNYHVLRSSGAGFTNGQWLSVPSWGGPNPLPMAMGDFNGDGKNDVVVNAYQSGQFYAATAQGAIENAVPNLLVTMTNGLAGSTTITHLPSTQFQNAPGALPYPVHAVTSLMTTDGNGNSSTSTYTYSGGYHHLGERDFRGFRTASVTSPGATDVEKTVTTTEFLQGRGVMVSGISTIAADDPQVNGEASLKGRPYRVTVAKKADLNFVYTKTETYYHDDRIGTNTTAPYFNPVAQVENSFCDGGPCKATGMSIAAADYDAYGNVLRESHHGDLSLVNIDERTVERAFVPANTTDYLVSFLARESIYKGISVAAANKLAETLFYYDGTGIGACTAAPTGSSTAVTKGKLTKVERWLSGGTNPVSGMEYDPTTGVLLCSRDPLGNRTTLTYDPTKTFVLTSTNQLGHVTTTVYSGVNGVTIDPATGFYGTVKSVTDPNGKVVNHEYDALGRRTKTTAPDGLVTQMAYPTLAEFGVIGTQKISTTTSGALLPSALTSSTFFDGLGRTIKKESSGPNGTILVTDTQYDVKGQVFRTSLPYFKTTESNVGRWRSMTYDPLGRVTQVTHPDTLSGSPVISKSCYAPFVTVTLDPSGERKRETKDAYGRVVKIEEYSTLFSTCDTTVGSPYATTNYTYDLLGNLTKVVDTLGNRTTMRYDTLNRKLAMSDPDMSTNGTSTCGDVTTITPAGTYPWYSSPCWNYQYDAAGNLTRQTDAKNQHLWFRYDGLNRRTQKDYTTQKAAGSGDVRYIYDDTVTTFNRKGRLKQAIDAATNVTFEYDAMGRVSKNTRVLDSTTYVTTSVYDGLGRLKEVTYPTSPAKTVEYLYTGPVLDKVQDKAGSGTTIYATYGSYTSQGKAQTITYGNGVVTTSAFADPAHPTCVPANSFKLCTLKTQKGTNPLYQDFTYTFTADGNVDLITDPINGNQDFSYDALDRLTSAIGPYGAGGATATLTYSYNEIGNMMSSDQPKLGGQPMGIYTYPASGPNSVRPHAVSVAGSYPITYDNNGNAIGMTDPTGFFGYSASYNTDNRLSSVTTTFASIPTTATFTYDGDGGRVKKIDGTTTTRYISKLYECDTTGATTSCSRFIWAGDTRIATVAVTSGAVHYWHGDHLGSSSVITDSAGAKVQAITYYPYGDLLTNQSFTTPAVNVPYKYTGKELDASSNVYFYEARYYHPVFGRFLSPDTLVPDPLNPQNLNRYSYAGNNPLRYLDPTGQAEIDAESGFWPGGRMPQYDGVSVRSWRMGQDTFFGRDFYTLQTNFSPSSFSRPWMSDGFGGGRFGSSLMGSGADFLRSMSSAEVLMVPEVHVTAGRPMASDAFSGWDWTQQGLGMAEAVPYPLVSTPAGLLNAGISTVRGHYDEAGWSALAAVPLVGMVSKLGPAYSSFSTLKRALGSAGENRQWHHIVEQAQIGKFGADAIHSRDNVISLSVDLHKDVSAYYSSKDIFTNNLTVREWLRNQSFNEQKEFGLRMIERMLGSPK